MTLGIGKTDEIEFFEFWYQKLMHKGSDLEFYSENFRSTESLTHSLGSLKKRSNNKLANCMIIN